MARVFISYSSRAQELAVQMKEWLSEQGFDQAFLDFDVIPPGGAWERTLYRQIESSQAVILILTPDWFASKWCFAEYTQARALGKAIFPVIEAPTQETIAPDVQHIDLSKDRVGGLERLKSALVSVALNAQGGFDFPYGRSPYPGLAAFQEEDAAIYFGRDEEIRELIELLRASRTFGKGDLIAILGASGSGKSSLLRAGIVPRLRRDAANWVLVPTVRLSSHPVRALARALASVLGFETDLGAIETALRGENATAELEKLGERLRLSKGRPEATVLVTFDQVEEVFTIASPGEKKAFLRLLEHFVAHQQLFQVLLTIRSDFLDAIQRTLLPFREFSLGPLPLVRFRQVIEGPAKVVGLSVEDALADIAAEDAKTEDALPLLAFALNELFQKYGKSGTLTLANYRALGDRSVDLSPLENGIRRAADTVISNRRPSQEELDGLRHAFIHGLVALKEGNYTRARARWKTLPDAAHELLEHLIAARLLVTQQEDGERVVEVGHEALYRTWPLLSAWLAEDREFLLWREHIQREFSAYQAGRRDLLARRELRIARDWLEKYSRDISRSLRNFIEASFAAEKNETRKRRFIFSAIGGVFGCFILGVSAYIAYFQMAGNTRRAAELAAFASQSLTSGFPNTAMRYSLASSDNLSFLTMNGAGEALLRTSFLEHYPTQVIASASKSAHPIEFGESYNLIPIATATGKIAIYSLVENRVVSTISIDSSDLLRRVDTALNSTRLIVSDWDSTKILQLPDGAELACFGKCPGKTTDASDSLLGKIFDQSSSRIKEISLARSQRYALFEKEDMIASSGDSLTVVTSNLLIVDLEMGAAVGPIPNEQCRRAGSRYAREKRCFDALAIAPDGASLIVASGHSIRFYHAPSKNLVRTLKVAENKAVRFLVPSPNNAKILVGFSSGEVELIDLSTDAIEGSFKPSSSSLREERPETQDYAISARFNSAGDAALISTARGSLYRWNLAEKETSFERSRLLALSLEQKELDISDVYEATSIQQVIIARRDEVRFTDSEYGSDHLALKLRKGERVLGYSVPANKVIISDADGNVKLVELFSAAVNSRHKIGAHVRNHDRAMGRKKFVIVTDERTVRMLADRGLEWSFEPDSQEETVNVAKLDSFSEFVLAKTSSKFGSKKRFYVISAATGKVAQVIEGDMGDGYRHNGFAYSHTDRAFYWLREDGTIERREVGREEPASSIRSCNAQPIKDFVLDAQTNKMIQLVKDGSLCIWSDGRSEPLVSQELKGAAVKQIFLAGLGTVVLLTGDDFLIMELRNLTIRPANFDKSDLKSDLLNSVEFSQDGSWLALSGYEKTLYWHRDRGPVALWKGGYSYRNVFGSNGQLLRFYENSLEGDLFNLPSSERVAKLRGHMARLVDGYFDDETLVTMSSRDVVAWSLESLRYERHALRAFVCRHIDSRSRYITSDEALEGTALVALKGRDLCDALNPPGVSKKGQSPS